MQVQSYKDWIQVTLEGGELADLSAMLFLLKIDRLDTASQLELATLISFLEADAELTSYPRIYDAIAGCYAVKWKLPNVFAPEDDVDYGVSLMINGTNPIKQIQTKFGYAIEHFELAPGQTLMDLYPTLRDKLTKPFRREKFSASEPEALPG